MDFIGPYLISLVILYLALRVLFKIGLSRKLFRRIITGIVIIIIISMLVQIFSESNIILVLIMWLIFSLLSYMYLQSRRGQAGRYSTAGGEREPIMPPVDDEDSE